MRRSRVAAAGPSSRETADVAAAEANLQFAQEEERSRYDDPDEVPAPAPFKACPSKTDAALLREKDSRQLQHGKSGPGSRAQRKGGRS